MDVLEQTVELLNSLSPLAVIGGLTFIIYLLIGKRGPVRLMSSNHLSGIPTLIEQAGRIEKALERNSDMLDEIRSCLSYIKGALDRK